MDNEQLVNAGVALLIALMTFLTAMIGYLTPRVRDWLSAEAGKAEAAGHGQQVAVGKELAQSAVLWAEQYLSGAQGAAKRDAAAAWLWKLANERGIDLPMTDAEKLIEEAVRVMQATGLDTQTTTAKRVELERDARGRFTAKRKPATEPASTTG